MQLDEENRQVPGRQPERSREEARRAKPVDIVQCVRLGSGRLRPALRDLGIQPVGDIIAGAGGIGEGEHSGAE